MSPLPEPTTSNKKVGQCVGKCPHEKAATMELLIGGPYTKENKTHPYGHVALRVKTSAKDMTYDYGRYRDAWGIGDSKGEGMLRVWTNFNKYIASENATGRETKGYQFEIMESDADKIITYFAFKTKGKEANLDRGHMKQYRIEDYHALRRNCTTIGVDGATIALPSLVQGSQMYNKGEGLDSTEKMGARLAGWPDRIFMPADLGNHLGSLVGERKPSAVNTYKKRKK